MRKTYQAHFQQAGFEVQCARSLPEAAERLARNRFDAVIADVCLTPEGSGSEGLAIAAYLGSGDTFDGAIADFAEAYADQNERDYETFKAAISAGRLATSAM